jgi:phosphoenolpyruvate carboxykinase (GTP)
METIKKNTIYTNVLLKKDKTVWWEGIDGPVPEEGLDWKGNAWMKNSTDAGANLNSRFTAPVYHCPSLSKNREDPQGVPISAFLFGGRRARLAPLVFESYNWQHDVYVGATMASERTAAQYGKQGEVRRNPMAMLPFCGYNMGEYFGHWLRMGTKAKQPPKVFHVNWFKQDDNGKFMWPEYGENLRVIKWIVDRCFDRVPAVETPIGYVPKIDGVDLSGLDVSRDVMEKLLSIGKGEWLADLESQKDFFGQYGDRLPAEIWSEADSLQPASRHYRVRRAPQSAVQGLNLWAMGMRLPIPKALEVTFSPGGAWRRLYSLRSTLTRTSFTISAGYPC